MFDINVGNAPADISEGDITEEHSKLGMSNALNEKLTCSRINDG